MTGTARSCLRVSYPRSPSNRPIFAAAERLVEVWNRNKRSLAALQALEHRADRARAYMDSPGANAALGMAYLGRVREQRLERLEELREGRRDAHRLLEFLRGLEEAAPAAAATTSPSPLPPACSPSSIATAPIKPMQRRYA